MRFYNNFDINTEEGFVMKHINFRIEKYHLGFSINHTDHKMELVSEWLPHTKFIKLDTPLCTDYEYDKDFVYAVPLTGDAIWKDKKRLPWKCWSQY